MSQLSTQIQDLQNNVNSLSDARECHDPDTASSSGASHVPSQPLIIPSPREVRCRDSGLPRDTRITMGTSGNVFESFLALAGPSPSVFENSKNLASSRGGIREPQSSETPTPRFNQGAATMNHCCHTGGTCSLNGMTDYPRFQISEMHLGNSLTQWSFKAGKSTSRLKHVLNSQCTGSKKLRWRNQ